MRDLLEECNSGQFKVPEGDFERQFCSRCVQPECSRSIKGESRFEKRVTTWKTRLFDQVPQMNPSDPRYLKIQQTSFIQIPVDSPASVSVGSGWDASTTQKVEHVQVPEVVAVSPETSTQFDGQIRQDIEPVSNEAERTPFPQAKRPAVFNTPVQPARMLAGASRAQETPKGDPWATSSPATVAPPPAVGTGEMIVKKGATVRLGGGGGVR